MLLPARTLAGFDTVTGIPHLPDGFSEVFESSLAPVDGVGLHTVQGGAGAPLLLVGGWPQNWYVWRFVMPRLAECFRVVAVDPRGVGRSGKPADGYDTATVAAELRSLIRQLRRPPRPPAAVPRQLNGEGAATDPDRIDDRPSGARAPPGHGRRAAGVRPPAPGRSGTPRRRRTGRPG